jgi:hypothetical protein
MLGIIYFYFRRFFYFLHLFDHRLFFLIEDLILLGQPDNLKEQRIDFLKLLYTLDLLLVLENRNLSLLLPHNDFLQQLVYFLFKTQ